jgi:hypothetical protein
VPPQEQNYQDPYTNVYGSQRGNSEAVLTDDSQNWEQRGQNETWLEDGDEKWSKTPETKW